MSEGMKYLVAKRPEAMKGLLTFFGKSVQALDRKTKELLALGMSMTAQCKYCVGVHAQKSLDAGASEAEIIDVCHVAMLMGGAPAMTYIAEVHMAMELYRTKQEQPA